MRRVVVLMVGINSVHYIERRGDTNKQPDHRGVTESQPEASVRRISHARDWIKIRACERAIDI